MTAKRALKLRAAAAETATRHWGVWARLGTGFRSIQGCVEANVEAGAAKNIGGK